MKHFINTYPLAIDALKSELRFLIDHFTKQNVTHCSVQFGWAWGMKYYKDKSWPAEMIALNELESKILEIERTEIGQFGSDDLFLTFNGLEFLFCHHSDIFINLEIPNPETEFFYQRWKELGYQPSEWINNTINGPGERIRHN